MYYNTPRKTTASLEHLRFCYLSTTPKMFYHNLTKNTFENIGGKYDFISVKLVFCFLDEVTWTHHSNEYCGYHWQGNTASFGACQDLCFDEGK